LTSRQATGLFAGVLAVYLAVAGGHLYTADDWSRFHAARSFLLHLSPELPDLPHVYGVPGSEGRVVSHFPPGLSLAVLPFLAAGHAAGRFAPDRQELLERTACSVFNQVVVAWLITLLYRLTGRLCHAHRQRLLLVLLAAFGTLAFPYAKHFWAEPLQTALLLGALLQLGAMSDGDIRVRRYFLFSASLAGGLLVKYETIVPAAVLIVGLAAVARPRGAARLMALAAPWCAAGVVLGAYNLWRFGSVFDLGYGGLVLPGPAGAAKAAVLGPSSMLKRLLLLLLSPGQGLFVFVPLAAVAFVRALTPSPDRVLNIGYAAAFALLLLYVALDRSSTWCWGPRYLFPSMILWWPALAGLSRRSWRRLALPGALGVLIAVLGVVVNFHDAIEEIKTSRGFGGWEWVAHVQREPALSPVIWHARLVGPYLWRTVEDARRPHVAAAAPVTWRHRHIDVVWLGVWAGGGSPAVLAVPAALLILGVRRLAACGVQAS
jgi:hypothetical protein